jgi:cytochrome oxidase Cu insertion factor (SCO1/SenC/PrrC family)
MPVRRLRSLLGIVTAVLLAAACSRGLPPEFPAPDFTLEDLFTGKEIRLADYQGRPVLLYFFASW